MLGCIEENDKESVQSLDQLVQDQMIQDLVNIVVEEEYDDNKDISDDGSFQSKNKNNNELLKFPSASKLQSPSSDVSTAWTNRNTE
jgi:hypothetical protein